MAGERANTKVEVRDLQEMRVATTRHIGSYAAIPEAFDRLGVVAEAEGLHEGPDAGVVGIYHDDPLTKREEELRSDAGIVVPEGRAIPASLTEQRIPAGRYATFVHVGPYAELGESWRRFRSEWIPAAGLKVSEGPSFERYLNMPGEVPPEDLRTELYIPIDLDG